MPNNYVINKYSQQSFVDGDIGSDMNGWVSIGNSWILQRGAAAYFADYFQNDAPVFWANDKRDTTISSVQTIFFYETRITDGKSLNMVDGGTLGNAAGPLLTFDVTDNELELSGGRLVVGATSGVAALEVGRPGSDQTFEQFRVVGYDTNSNFILNNGIQQSLELSLSSSDAAIVFSIDGHRKEVLMPSIKSGATQAAAGALADEIWKTASHAILPDNVLLIGV